MTLGTTPSIKDRLNYNFVNLFRSSNRREFPISSQNVNPVIYRLVKHELLSIKTLSVSKADEIFLFDRYNITFTLSDKFANHFVLMRGLLEFSRPGKIKIISNVNDRSFHVDISERDADDLLTHLEITLNALVKEIKFKESLRALINFEEKVKQGQARLFASLRQSA